MLSLGASHGAGNGGSSPLRHHGVVDGFPAPTKVAVLVVVAGAALTALPSSMGVPGMLPPPLALGRTGGQHLGGHTTPLPTTPLAARICLSTKLAPTQGEVLSKFCT